MHQITRVAKYHVVMLQYVGQRLHSKVCQSVPESPSPDGVAPCADSPPLSGTWSYSTAARGQHIEGGISCSPARLALISFR